MFSRKVIGAIEILCLLDISGPTKVLAEEVRKLSTLDTISFRSSMNILSKVKYIERTVANPIKLTLKVSLNDISLWDIMKICHEGFIFGEMYPIEDSIYNYRYLSEWYKLTSIEKEFEESIITQFKNIKISQIKPSIL